MAKRGKTASLLKSVLYFEYFKNFEFFFNNSFCYLLLYQNTTYLQKSRSQFIFYLADRRARSLGVIFKILTFLKCLKKELFLGYIILFGILTKFFQRSFFEMFGHLIFMFDWILFFHFPKIGILLKILPGWVKMG